ncbi:MAG: hypothetical protein RXR18_04815 [Nitrososphaeria archaeon]
MGGSMLTYLASLAGCLFFVSLILIFPMGLWVAVVGGSIILGDAYVTPSGLYIVSQSAVIPQLVVKWFIPINIFALTPRVAYFTVFTILMLLGELFTIPAVTCTADPECGMDTCKGAAYMQIFIFAAMVLFPIVNHPIFTVFATPLPILMRILLLFSLSSYITLMASAAIATIQAVISLIHVRKGGGGG